MRFLNLFSNTHWVAWERISCESLINHLYKYTTTENDIKNNFGLYRQRGNNELSSSAIIIGIKNLEDFIDNVFHRDKENTTYTPEQKEHCGNTQAD